MGSLKHVILNRPDGAYLVTAYAFYDEPTIRVLAIRLQTSESPDEGCFAWLDGGLASWTSSTGLSRRAHVGGDYRLIANVRVPAPKAPLARDVVYYRDYEFRVDRKKGAKVLRRLEGDWLLGYVAGVFSRIEFSYLPTERLSLPTQEIR